MINEYLNMLQEDSRPIPIELNSKIKALSINNLPSELKSFSINWPGIIKKKNGPKVSYKGYTKTYKDIIKLPSQELESIQRELVYRLNENQKNDFNYDDSSPKDNDNWYQSRYSLRNTSLANNNLFVGFFSLDSHGAAIWCYSLKDKHVYFYNGHDESSGFFDSRDKNAKLIARIPYKNWLNLWEKYCCYCRESWGEKIPDYGFYIPMEKQSNIKDYKPCN